jgi:hypothetical protein
MRRAALALAAFACLSLLTGFFVQPEVAGWPVAFGCALLPTALILLGTVRRGVAAKWLRFGILLLFLVLVGVFGALLVLAGNDPAGAHATIRLLLQLGGLWLATLVLTGLVFPATFDAFWPDSATAVRVEDDRNEEPAVE